VPVDAYVEIGSKRAFAGALDWPGWCRAGRDEEAAIEALFAYADRYAAVVEGSDIWFAPPSRVSTIRIHERLTGDATTDFGAPSIAPDADGREIDRRWLTRQTKLLRASWDAFDLAVGGVGRALAKGPRGGGRQLNGIVAHVVGAEASYLKMIGGRAKSFEDPDRKAATAREEERALVVEALERALTDGIPARGPRGGARWTAPYFVRRAAWHVLDHAWEIEDRS
jgi:hypothetical protein